VGNGLAASAGGEAPDDTDRDLVQTLLIERLVMKPPASRIELVPLDKLHPYERNARVHSKKQVGQIARSIERFGFTCPLMISDDYMILAGHGRWAAAKQLGMVEVPCVRLSHLTPEERRAYILADNKTALNSTYDVEVLAGELQALGDLDFDLSLTGFSIHEVDTLIVQAEEASPKAKLDKADVIPVVDDACVVTRPGDVWRLGRHRLVCGDARDPAAYDRLLGTEIVDLLMCDVPYNVPVNGHVCGKGSIRHAEFAMASGEMSEGDFIAFLEASLGAAAARCKDGAIGYVFIDWRHYGELTAAAKSVFTEQKNLIVWNKQNAGMGTFYRSKHELIGVYKVGKGEHVNTFGLGGEGRYRTNVWDYPGVTSVGAGRMEALSWHPTVKPVAMIKDALLDCSRRGDIVLDSFGGSGATLIAAQKCGRVARLIELEPRYCDVIITRFQNLTGQMAVLDSDGRSSEDVADERLGASDAEVAHG
jgi:DNA modification methylase